MNLNKFFNDNKKLYAKLANKIIQDRKQDYDDALQYLYLASLDMIPRYYKENKSKATTFVYSYVYKRALRMYRENKHVVRIPVWAQDKINDFDYYSIDDKTYTNSEYTFLDIISTKEDKEFKNMDERIYNEYLSEVINKSLNRLTDRHRKIIEDIYLTEGKHRGQLKEIAKDYNVTPQRVTQMKEQALANMNKYLKRRVEL